MKSLVTVLLLFSLVSSGPAISRTREGTRQRSTGLTVTEEGIRRIILKYRNPWVKGKQLQRTLRLLPGLLLKEAKRNNLDPVALIAIAKIESSFNIWSTGRAYVPWNPSVGIWQLIWMDSPVVEAWKELRRHPSRYPEIVRERHGRTGNFTKRELRNNITISTWVAGYEIALHVKTCKRNHPRSHYYYFMRKWSRKNPLFNAKKLIRYSHFNGGPRYVPYAYTRKLFYYYALFYKELSRKN